VAKISSAPPVAYMQPDRNWDDCPHDYASKMVCKISGWGKGCDGLQIGSIKRFVDDPQVWQCVEDQMIKTIKDLGGYRVDDPKITRPNAMSQSAPSVEQPPSSSPDWT
jgi:hypothetical protein